MIRILNKAGEVLRAVDADSLRGSDLRGSDLRYADLRGADLRCADLRDADLRYADLRGADLRDADLRCANLFDANLIYADLRGADLRGANLIVIAWGWWTTYITKNHIRIGCQSHTLEDWKNFSDDEINNMDSKALEFWKQNKELIIGLCERFETNKGD